MHQHSAITLHKPEVCSRKWNVVIYMWQNLTLGIMFLRKQSLQLQFPRQTGHSSAIASSDR